MDRRSFLRNAAILPVAIPAAAMTMPARALPYIEANRFYGRISCESGDPGEIAYGKLCADYKKAKVLFNGTECKAVTADSIEGWVKRPIVSENGNIAFNPATQEILHETVHGRVEIIIVDWDRRMQRVDPRGYDWPA